MMITLKCSMTIMWWNYCRTNWTYFRDIRRKDASVLVIKIRSSVQQYHHDYRFRNFLSVNIFLHHFVSRESRDNSNISSIETLLKKNPLPANVYLFKTINENTRKRCETSQKMIILWVILVRIQSECRKIRTRITTNTDTFYAVSFVDFVIFSRQFIYLKFY